MVTMVVVEVEVEVEVQLEVVKVVKVVVVVAETTVVVEGINAGTLRRQPAAEPGTSTSSNSRQNLGEAPAARWVLALRMVKSVFSSNTLPS
ncbi:hypothetical protein M0802_002854 [Mischocyttarus mexicanus]|nr:hypothetical protein M0802_002854 [Mischocyttarus mexicanus]